MTHVIEVEHLTRRFGERVAVDDQTYTVEAGEVFGLLGPNGAGKTTTIRLLNGILGLSGGKARVLGLDPIADGQRVRQQTGVLTETPALYERLTARQNLAFFATLAGVPANEVAGRVDQILERFELLDRAGERVGGYSKGMKQRLALARALIHQPPLLFLDEPTAGLDPEAAQAVNDLIETVSHEEGQTVVLCTHNLVEAQRLCDRVAVLNRGRLLAVGSVQELARSLWPGLRVEMEFAAPVTRDAVDALRGMRGILSLTAPDDLCGLKLQVEERSVIPPLVTHLAQRGAQIVRVTPQDYSLEEIYFTLQDRGNGHMAGKEAKQ